MLENLRVYFNLKFSKPFKNDSFLLNWCVFLINGHYQSYIFEKNSMVFQMILITRRECSNLGTRYNRRGLNEHGFAANFVEIE